MTLSHRTLVVATCLGALAVCAGTGCKRESVDRDGYAERNFDKGATDRSGAGDRTGTTTITGANVGGTLSNENAIERIVAARCARETACNNIGSDKHFVNTDTCNRELRGKVADDLKASECPKGIDAKELNECMESIRTESCNNPIDTISRLAACRSSDMCLKVDSTNR